MSLRAVRLFTFAAVALAACFVNVQAATAQSFVEFGGGWSYRQSAPANDSYNLGINARLSVGRRVSDHVLLRADAFMIQYTRTDTTLTYPPCAFGVVCSPIPSVSRRANSVAGLTVNGIVELDPRGIFYLIGGAGLDEAFGRANGSYNETHLGASFGAGFAVPVGKRLRVVLEAQLHEMLGATAGTPWFVPITIGVRY